MKLLKPSELSNLPITPSVWIVEGLLRLNRKRVSLLCGSPHSGKSTVARQLAIAVSHGDTFLGRETVKSKVLYWQSEETEEDACEDFTRSGMRACDDGFLVIMQPTAGDGHLSDLAKALDNDPDIRLVIIETLDDFLQMDDLSDNPSTRRAFEKFYSKVLARHAHRCCFLVLHHFKKSDDQKGLNLNRILGATVIAGKTDAKIYMRQVNDSDERRCIQVQIRKGLPIEPTYLNFTEENQSSTLGITLADEKRAAKTATLRVNESDLRGKVIAEVMNNPAQPKRITTKNVGGTFRVAFDMVNALIEEGEIVVDKIGRADLLYPKGAPQCRNQWCKNHTDGGEFCKACEKGLHAAANA
jgi:KaiC/GvpD/RAD55 family RecA-like ATPase